MILQLAQHQTNCQASGRKVNKGSKSTSLFLVSTLYDLEPSLYHRDGSSQYFSN